MARAPKPGQTPTSNNDKDPERKGFLITWEGKGTWTFHSSDLGPRDHMMVRKETGMPFRWFIQTDHHDIDTFGVMVWMARRKNGELALSLDKVFDELGTDEQFNKMVKSGTLTIKAIEDGEEDEDDPLSSDAD